jgi:hypothetical protein
LTLSLIALAVLALAIACGGNGRSSETNFSEFIDSRPINGSVGTSWNFPGDGSLWALVADADAIGVFEVLRVVDVTNIPPPPLEFQRPAVGLVYSTYRAKAEQWVKGAGPSEFLVTELGGVSPVHPELGPIFFNGDFLLESGRKYVLLLWEKSSESPGTGQYLSGAGGRGWFEVTDGLVHVLNHPLTQDLQEEFGGMPLADFVQVLRGYVANPPPSPTPRPAAAEIGPPPTTSLAVNSVGIDTDVKRTAANTATSLGSLNSCNTLTSGGSLTIDIAVDAVPPSDSATDTGGITGFQFSLLYDASVVKVTASDAEMLLAANPGSSLVSLGDATPDTDGSFLVAVSDFGSSTTPESGSGVLARITLQGVAPGVSQLTLTDLAIADVSTARYGINSTPAAEVAVDAPCP